MNDLLDPVYEEGKREGFRQASHIVMAKHRELATAQRRTFDGKRHLALGVLAQVIRSLRNASR